MSIQNKIAALALVTAVGASHAAVLDFNSGVPLIANLGGWGYVDDLATYNGFTFQFESPPSVPGAPANYSWTWGTEGSVFYPGLPFYTSGVSSNGFLNHVPYDPNSPVLILTDSLGISNPTPFYFWGAKFDGYGGAPISYKLYDGVNGDNFLGESTAGFVPGVAFNSPNPGPMFFANSMQVLVTRVVVFSAQGLYGMDDFSYGAQPIPEPSTYLMMIAGLLGVGAVARRKMKAKA